MAERLYQARVAAYLEAKACDLKAEKERKRMQEGIDQARLEIISSGEKGALASMGKFRKRDPKKDHVQSFGKRSIDMANEVRIDMFACVCVEHRRRVYGI